MKNLSFLGYENYSVTRCGKVFSHNVGDFKKLPYCRQGYNYVLLSKKSKKRKYLVHRLVALAFIPNPENKRTVNHKDGVKDNNHVDNLEWNTHLENIRHSIENNLRVKDIVRCVRTRSEEDIHILCKMTMEGYSRGDIFRKHGLPEWLVKNVVTGRQYRDVSKHYDLENRPQVLYGMGVKAIQRVYYLHGIGWSAKGISKELSVDVDKVLKIVNREVLPEMYDRLINNTIAETIPKGSTLKRVEAHSTQNGW